jgi:hypothetical protein
MRKQKNRKKEKYVYIPNRLFSLLFLLFLFLGALTLGTKISGYFQIPSPEDIEKNIPNIAQEIDDKCRDDINRDTCFAIAFYDLAQKNDSTYAVKTLLHLQQIDPKNTRGCHFIAHKISQAETEKDPSKWEDVIRKVSPTMCTGGFLHGVLETHLATDPDFTINENSITHICQNVLSGAPGGGFAERSCSHNMGHLMMVQEENQISRTVEKCNKITNPGFHYECLSGAFMERLTAENLIAHDLIKVKPRWNEDLARETEKLCAEYTGLAAKACWKELSYVYFSINNNEPLGLHKECQNAPTQEIRDECYIYGAGNMINSGRFKEENLIVLCHQFDLNDPMFNRCMNQTIGSLLTSTTDNLERTLSICQKTYPQYKGNCYAKIVTILTRNGAPKNLIDKTCLQLTSDLRTQICRG